MWRHVKIGRAELVPELIIIKIYSSLDICIVCILVDAFRVYRALLHINLLLAMLQNYILLRVRDISLVYDLWKHVTLGEILKVIRL